MVNQDNTKLTGVPVVYRAGNRAIITQIAKPTAAEYVITKGAQSIEQGAMLALAETYDGVESYPMTPEGWQAIRGIECLWMEGDCPEDAHYDVQSLWPLWPDIATLKSQALERISQARKEVIAAGCDYRGLNMRCDAASIAAMVGVRDSIDEHEAASIKFSDGWLDMTRDEVSALISEMRLTSQTAFDYQQSCERAIEAINEASIWDTAREIKDFEW